MVALILLVNSKHKTLDAALLAKTKRDRKNSVADDTHRLLLPYVMSTLDTGCEVAEPCEERRHSRQDLSVEHCRNTCQLESNVAKCSGTWSLCSEKSRLFLTC